MKAAEEVVAFGLHAVRHALHEGVAATTADAVLLLQSGRGDKRLLEVSRLAKSQGLPVRMSERSELDRIAGGRHQGVVILGRERHADQPDLATLLEGIDDTPLLLVLDGVQDPHNLGACLRSADAAGAHAVIVPRRRAAGMGATVRKVAAGAAEHIPLIAVANLARTMRFLSDQGLRLLGTSEDAEKSVFAADLTGPLALVMGSEDKGLRRLTREHCDELLSLPMGGSVESLNVSVAAGVFLFEAVRQRQGAG
ncbi:MAG: 23S rRNA (guanosine(2251)-2'-O)-methyltransferase RlmB [Gammaproteobacteria bacterium]|nr:23S rRNA (guanosine(2251)-2'-O)-methyltransferase RlmB [Gammaproteobacteria bacterium]